MSATVTGVTTHVPVGVVVLLTPSSNPLGVAARKVSAALAAGCTVVVKPHPEAPLSAIALGVLAARAGVVEGGVNVVVLRDGGEGEGVARMIAEKGVGMVSFTGQRGVGIALGRAAARRGLRFRAEMGCVGAAFVVFDDADVGKAVEGLVGAKVRAGGQSCVAPDRVLVQEGIFEKFLEMLRVRVRVLGERVGDGMEEGVEIGPMINMRAVLRLHGLVDEAVRLGAVVEVGARDRGNGRAEGGEGSDGLNSDDEPDSRRNPISSSAPRIVVNGVVKRANIDAASADISAAADPATADDGSLSSASRGSFFPPTLLSAVTPAMRVFRKEILGPIFAVAKFADDDEPATALRCSDDVAPGGLAAYVYTSSISRKRRMVQELDVGMVAVNCVDLSDPRTPFGGIGIAGESRGSGEGLSDYTNLKYVLESS